MTSPKPIQPLFWKAVIPTAAVLLFTLGCLVARNLMVFQLATMYTLAYAGFVFTVGAIYYRPRANSGEEQLPDDELPMVSILIPAHNEENVIGHTISHMLRLDYPRFEVIVIDDHSSDRTSQIVRQYPVELVMRRNLPNRGKSEALNTGLEVARGDIICVFDADSEVSPDFLRRAVAPLVNDPEVCGVQAQVRMYNRRQNLLTQMQDDEFALYNEILQVGREVLGGAAALGGNGQLTRRSALKAVGGWSPSSLTEDLDLTMRLFLAGRGRIAHTSAAVVWQEGVPTFKALLRQRTRWAEGMLRCFGDYAFAVLASKEMPGKLRIDAFYALFSVFMPIMSVAGVLFTTLALVPGFFTHVLPYGIGQEISAALLVAGFVWSATVSLKRDRTIDLWPGLRYMVYILHWAPALACALNNVLRDMPVVWEKTEHLGQDLVGVGLPHRAPTAELANP
ncbi:MAG: glycosyl transferase family 2 [Cyanobacteria bacterium RYN_339]|nr:glycosyl transferase family 2 [Cyanobacteria bacterium RYN_339]